MGDQDLSRNYAPDRIPGPSGDAILVAGTASATRSAALTVGQSYRVTAYGGAGYVKFGGSDVEVTDSDYHCMMGIHYLAEDAESVTLFDLGDPLMVHEGFEYCSVVRIGAVDCSVLMTPVS